MLIAHTLAVCGMIFCAIGIVAGLVLPRVNCEFDFDTQHATFFILYQQYAKAIWAIFWAGIAGAFAYQHFVGVGMAAGFLLASGIYALLLNVWLLTTYERYLHARYPRNTSPGRSNYTAGKYAVTLALAGSTILTFILGVASALVGMK